MNAPPTTSSDRGEQIRQTSDPARPPKRPRKRRIRSEAIAIKPDPGRNYPYVLKDVQVNVKPDDRGISVKMIKKTRTGQFGAALAGALGDSSDVRHLFPRRKVVVYDLVETTEATDVEEALKGTLE